MTHPFKQLRPLALLLVLLLITCSVFAQDDRERKTVREESGTSERLTQTVRGRVFDNVTQQPLEGATVRTADTLKPIGTYTDDNGRFELNKVPVGRQMLIITYLGYEPVTLRNQLVVSGRELVVQVPMIEQVIEQEAVEINAKKNDGQALNTFATVSARSFDSQQADRYAGSLGDPGRMAANFAGVNNAGDTRNDIVVRGNSPIGLLWRMEGLDIPNPNHFSTQGANGGPISMLNNNTLGTSDFFTSAFPAQYGNAYAGAFDLNLRQGNTSTYEGLFQIGFAGFEGLVEGPLKKNSGSSFLVAGRYSTLAMFDLLGISFGDLAAVPKYQDLTFNVNIDLKRAGQLQIFGIGGRSNIDIVQSELTDEEFNDLSFADYQDVYQRVNMGVAGVSHSIGLGENGFLKSTLGVTTENRELEVDSLDVNRSPSDNYGEQYGMWQLQLHEQYTHKFSARHNTRVGFQGKFRTHNIEDSIYRRLPDSSSIAVPLTDIEQKSTLLQLYANHEFRLTSDFSINGGVHGMYYDLNDTWAIEPRVGMQWNVTQKHTLSAGAGIHHQTLPIQVYMVTDTASGHRENIDLELLRNHHVVLGYEFRPFTNFRAKIEGYYQYMTSVPVTVEPGSYSAVNAGANFERLPTDNLESTGTAQNFGVELTLEKFLANNYYFLITGSLFDATYAASNGQIYDAAFNTQYVMNALAGVEYALGKNGKWDVFADGRIVMAGGRPYTPFDAERSQQFNTPVLDTERAFSERAKPYFRADIRFGVRQKFKTITQEFAVDLQNVTNHRNEFRRSYDTRTGREGASEQLGFFPVVQYRLYF